MKVELLEMTANPEEIIYSAARQCYSEKDAYKIFIEAKNIKKDKIRKFINEIVKSGHESVLEHVKFTFAISGVSRALTHQLIRHRIASYSQQSQRYVNMENFNYIIPPSIKNDKILLEIYQGILNEIKEAYKKLIRRFKEMEMEGEIANQDARYILPNAIETKIVVTMNCRELINFFKVRCCSRAQWEIRDLAYEMLKICKENLPSVFEKSGPKCEYLGYCPEGEKFSCGKYPLKNEVIKND